jgi:hypothetical protein
MEVVTVIALEVDTHEPTSKRQATANTVAAFLIE